MTFRDVHGRPRLPNFQLTAARREDCTGTFGLSMRDELADPVPGFRTVR